MSLTYFSPSTLEEACKLLESHGRAAKILAGGTDVVVNMRSGKETPEIIIDLSKIKQLQGIGVTDSMITLGALVTFSELEAHSDLGAKLPALVVAAKAVGSPQIRNRGTVGGNIANASPAADVVPALLALDATAVLSTNQSSREVGLQELLLGPYQTSIAEDEILIEIKIPIPKAGTGMSFAKVGRRNALAIARLNGACLLRRNGEVLEDLSLVIGAATPTARKCTKVEEFLKGQTPTPELFAQAGEIARESVLEVTGNRPSSAYKLPVVKSLTERLLEEAWEKGGARYE